MHEERHFCTKILCIRVHFSTKTYFSTRVKKNIIKKQKEKFTKQNNKKKKSYCPTVRYRAHSDSKNSKLIIYLI